MSIDLSKKSSIPPQVKQQIMQSKDFMDAMETKLEGKRVEFAHDDEIRLLINGILDRIPFSNLNIDRLTYNSFCCDPLSEQALGTATITINTLLGMKPIDIFASNYTNEKYRWLVEVLTQHQSAIEEVIAPIKARVIRDIYNNAMAKNAIKV